MTRWSAAVVGLGLAAMVGAGCKDKNKDAVTMAPDEDAVRLESLRPLEATRTGSEARSPLYTLQAYPQLGTVVPNEEPFVEASGAPRVHVMAPKDTLYSLAVRYYSDGKQWERILEANRARFDDPHLIPVGAKLIIP